jgi:DNA-binding SARP family transcriptional activator
VDRGENDDQRMRVHWWLAEAQLALGERRGVEQHLATALALVRERGYTHFLRQRAREAPEPLVHALAHGLEVEACAGALVEAGAPAEGALLELAATAPARPAEAALSVLAECGSTDALGRLRALAAKRRGIASAARAAVAGIESRARSASRQDTSAPTARLGLFGPPHIELGERVLPASAWRSQRAFHVLILLVLTPRGSARDVLLETFWPGRQLAAGRRNFHPTLSYIRSVLPRHNAPPLLRDAEVYRLNPDYPLACDAWEFDAALDSARREAPPARLETLERAIAIADRPALDGVYGAWAESFQRRMRERVESARLQAGELRRAQGDLAGALAHFRCAAELDEFNETTRVRVIECNAALGHRAAALAEYEKLRTDLRRALDVDPLPETEGAVRKALAGRDGRPDHSPQSQVAQ